MLKLMTSSPLRRSASSIAARSEHVPAEVAQMRSPGAASGRSSVVLTTQTVGTRGGGPCAVGVWPAGRRGGGERGGFVAPGLLQHLHARGAELPRLVGGADVAVRQPPDACETRAHGGAAAGERLRRRQRVVARADLHGDRLLREPHEHPTPGPIGDERLGEPQLQPPRPLRGDEDLGDDAAGREPAPAGVEADAGAARRVGRVEDAAPVDVRDRGHDARSTVSDECVDLERRHGSGLVDPDGDGEVLADPSGGRCRDPQRRAARRDRRRYEDERRDARRQPGGAS